jgi:hypothetical protein
MALKHKLDEAAFKTLSEGLKAEYKKQDDGTYVLDVEGLEDTGALKRAKDHEKELRKQAQAEAKKALDDLNALHAEYDDHKTKGGSKEAELEKAWQAKMAKREKELTAQLDLTQNALRNTMQETVATSLAAELAGDNAEIILPHIQRRLKADIVDGKAVTKVLGPDGEVSATTIDELKKEFFTNARFAAVIVGSKGSGGGAGGSRKGSGGAAKKLSEMTATEEAQFANENPSEYQKMIQGA